MWFRSAAQFISPRNCTHSKIIKKQWFEASCHALSIEDFPLLWNILLEGLNYSIRLNYCFPVFFFQGWPDYQFSCREFATGFTHKLINPSCTENFTDWHPNRRISLQTFSSSQFSLKAFSKLSSDNKSEKFLLSNSFLRVLPWKSKLNKPVRCLSSLFQASWCCRL